MKFNLRPYQLQAVENITKGIKSGIRRQVIVLATGTGKTVIFSQLPAKVKLAGKKTLILAHRAELLAQAKRKIQEIAPHLSVEIEQGSQVAEPNTDVIIASVATIGRKDSKRLAKFNPEHFGLIIIDEAHHAVASTYRNVLEYFGANKNGNLRDNHPVLLGVTATPNRADNIGLSEVFDEIVFKYDIKNGIDDGYLSPIKAFSVYTKSSIKDVNTSRGDFAISELADAVNNPERNRLIVDAYKEISNNETAIAFCVNIEHALDLRDTFRERGYSAETVTGKTPADEREKILASFEAQEIDILTNVGIATEGYDNPAIKTVLMASPTKSGTLYSQKVGRGLRLFEGKTHMNLIDFVDSHKKNSIITSSSLIGLERPVKANGEFIMEMKDKFEELLSVAPGKDYENLDLSNIEKVIEEVDVFEQARLALIVSTYSEFAWTQIEKTSFQLTLGRIDNSPYIAELSINLLNKYEIKVKKLIPQRPTPQNGFKKYRKIIDNEQTLDTSIAAMALKDADSWLRNTYKGKITFSMIQQTAPWRMDNPTEKQLALLKKLGVPGAENKTKGEASMLLNKLLSKKRK